jgi:hypothetical protein
MISAYVKYLPHKQLQFCRQSEKYIQRKFTSRVTASYIGAKLNTYIHRDSDAGISVLKILAEV